MDMNDPTTGASGSGGEPDEVDLTAEEREGFARLADQATPSDLLEEKVVGALRSRGILGRRATPVEPAAAIGPVSRARSGGHRESGRVAGRSGRARPGRSWWSSPWSWAAGVALFLGGGVLGHGIGARTTADAFLAVREQDTALRVQEAGTAYVSALLALEAMQGGSSVPAEDDRGAAQAREVASSTLLAAASAYSRLDPDGPLTPMLTALLEEQVDPRAGTAGKQQTIWF